MAKNKINKANEGGKNKMKEIKKINMFCSICESIHDISLMEEEREIIIKGEKIKYKELYYKCPKYQNNNIFMSGDLWNINLINSLDEYRKKKDIGNKIYSRRNNV